eukprot:1092041-Alexandrium_andersonii.AAC.1
MQEAPRPPPLPWAAAVPGTPKIWGTATGQVRRTMQEGTPAARVRLGRSRQPQRGVHTHPD